MTNAEAVMGGCDLTADCPVDDHAEGCWRGYWSATEREVCGAPHPYAGEPCTRPKGHEGGHGNAERAWLAGATDREVGGSS